VFEFYLYARKWPGVRPVLRRNLLCMRPNFGSATYRRLACTWVGRVGLGLAGRGARMEVARWEEEEDSAETEREEGMSGWGPRDRERGGRRKELRKLQKRPSLFYFRPKLSDTRHR